MKNSILAILLAVCCFTSVSVAKVAKNGVVFTDKKSFELSLVKYGEAKDKKYLVQFKGYDDEDEGKVFLVTESGGGTSARYFAKEDDSNILRAPPHEYFGWEAYIGDKTFKVSEDAEKSKALDTSLMLKLFTQKK